LVDHRRQILEHHPATEARMSSIDLPSHARNEHSQWGEDGILEKLFDLIGIDRGYFVEFGAWDGIRFSNTYALYRKGWSGCYIEASSTRFLELQKNATSDRVTNVNVLVTVTGENSFDRIMARVKAPRVIDLLSIDIDSDDLAIWRSVSAYIPKVVIVEYNPTISFDTEFENVPGKNWGNSALSLVKLGKEKGYDLVCATQTNLIFLKRDLNRNLGLAVIDLNSIGRKMRFFWGYDGTLLRSDESGARCDEVFFLPWGKSIGFQPLPALLRTYADRCSATSIARILYTGLSSLLIRPLSTLKFVGEALGVLRRS
jgi:hypothetical protein